MKKLKKKGENKEGAEFEERISEISKTLVKISERQSEIEEKVLVLLNEVAEMSKKISEDVQRMSKELTEFKKELSRFKKPEGKRENKFILVVREMVEEQKTISESKEFNFILDILKLLPQKAVDLPRSFESLVYSLWVDLYTKYAKKGFSQSDTNEALSALIEFTDVFRVRHQREIPHRLFIFNEKSEFFWKFAPLFYKSSQE